MKRLFCLLMVCIICTTPLTFAVPIDDANPGLSTSRRKVLVVQDKVTTLSSVETASTADFKSLSTTKLSTFDMVVLGQEDFGALSRESAFAVLNGGGVIAMATTAPNEALESIYALLDLEKPMKICYDGVSPIGVFVSVGYGSVRPGIIAKGHLRGEDKTDSTYAYQEIPASSAAALLNTIDAEKLIENVCIERTVWKNAVASASPRLSPSDFDEDFQSSIVFSNGQQPSCTVFITQYIHKICRYSTANGITQISDVVSWIAVTPDDTSFVKKYKTRIATGLETILMEGAYLNSNSSSSETFSGGISLGTGETLLSGEIGGSTTYTYNTNNQTIQNRYPSNTYFEWTSTPTREWLGAGWALVPGARVKSPQANRFMSTAYTSVQEVQLKKNGATNAYTYTEPFAVGGQW